MARPSSASGRGAGIFDLAVAALAGGSAAFAAFAMPDRLFAQIVVASRLPEILAAAQPPLGDTARWAAVAAAGVATALLVWALLRALDHVPAGRLSRPGAAPAGDEPFADALRVRRADAHPDAPARRPLRAGRELGEPDEPPPAEDTLELVEVEPEERFADLIPQPLPGFLVPQEEAEEIAGADRPAEADESLETLSAQLPDAAGDGGGKSISDLMQRLESGLSRRERAAAEEAAAPPAAAVPPVAAPPADAPPPPPTKPSRTPLDLSSPAPPQVEEAPPAEDRVGHRLRSAISDLQKLSGHG